MHLITKVDQKSEYSILIGPRLYHVKKLMIDSDWSAAEPRGITYSAGSILIGRTVSWKPFPMIVKCKILIKFPITSIYVYHDGRARDR